MQKNKEVNNFFFVSGIPNPKKVTVFGNRVIADVIS